MSPRIQQLTEMSWVEIEALDKDKTVILLPISPIEEHGPHLPVGTDIFGAHDIAQLAAINVVEKNSTLQPILSPTIPLGCAPITADFPGTISIRGKTLYNLLVDFCSGLADSGFKYIVIVNHHLDSMHLKAILEAIETVCERYGIKMIETAGRILYSRMPLDEITKSEEMGLSMKTEIHADVRETSFIQYKYPHLIKQDLEELPSVHIDIRDGLKKGLKTFKAMGAGQGYIGTPARATKALGKIHLEEQAEITAEMIIQLISGQPLPEMSPGILKYLKESIQL
ncbi:creatininase family protein [Desulfosediminicola flagellatus]|uniref:creatininase family protein n=1 Tax=Desulfosediminicola flagellatus TaxID=2569541 RepID=UPI0010ACAB0C|nr:creatininase family protein [Desulfosediminicola flagellatus]